MSCGHSYNTGWVAGCIHPFFAALPPLLCPPSTPLPSPLPPPIHPCLPPHPCSPHTPIPQATDYEISIYAPGPWNCASTPTACSSMLRLSIGPLLTRLLHNMDAALARAARRAAACGRPAAAPDAEASPSVGAAAGGACDGSHGNLPGSDEEADEKLPKLFLWSGHDTTVMPLLTALGYETHQWPTFTANIAFELWRGAGGAPWVRVLYNGEPLPWQGAGEAGSSRGGGGSGRGGAHAGQHAERAGEGHEDGHGQQQQNQQQHWKRSQQEQPQQQEQQQAAHAGGESAASGSGGEGGSSGGGNGWVGLEALRQRLLKIAATDSEKEEACWPEGKVALS